MERPGEGPQLGRDKPGNRHTREERAAWMEAMQAGREERREKHKERDRVKAIKNTPVFGWVAPDPWMDELRLIWSLVAQMPVNVLCQVADVTAGGSAVVLSVMEARAELCRVGSVRVSGVVLDGIRKDVQAAGYIPRWSTVQGSPVEAAKQWKRPVDLLLEDSGYDYQSKRDSLLAWFKHLKAGALVWSGAYGNEAFPGVKMAIDELVAEGRLEFMQTAGYSWAGRFLR